MISIKYNVCHMIKSYNWNSIGSSDSTSQHGKSNRIETCIPPPKKKGFIYIHLYKMNPLNQKLNVENSRKHFRYII